MLYALSICAIQDKTENGNLIKITEMRAAFTPNANSDEEATGIGLKLARISWPPEEGWHSHGCTFCRATENVN